MRVTERNLYDMYYDAFILYMRKSITLVSSEICWRLAASKSSVEDTLEKFMAIGCHET